MGNVVKGKTITNSINKYICLSILEICDGCNISYLTKAIKTIEDSIGKHKVLYDSQEFRDELIKYIEENDI